MDSNHETPPGQDIDQLAVEAERGYTPEQLRPRDRLNINLSAAARNDLEEAARLTGRTKTDVVGSAVGLYLMAFRAQMSGGSVVVRQTPGAEPERLWFV